MIQSESFSYDVNLPLAVMEGDAVSCRQWVTRFVTPADRNEVRCLFERVFGHEMSEALWGWKYGYSQPLAVGVWNHGRRLVGHYGGLARDVSYYGTETRALQSCDVMIESMGRGALTRRGPFYLLAKNLGELIGFNRPFLLGYGFPNERHLQLGIKLGLYAQVGRIFEVVWHTKRNIYRHGLNSVDWSDAATDQCIDKLWEEMRASLNNMIVAKRNAAWWRHRFVDHPLHVYHSYWLINRITRRRIAIFTIKMEGERSQLMDWVGDVKFVAPILVAARHVAGKNGAMEIYGWFCESLAKRMKKDSIRFVDLAVGVGASLCNPGPSSQELDGRWWLTGGDTDFL